MTTMATTQEKMTNAAVAERIGLDHTTVSRIRSADRLPSSSVLYRFHREFGIPLEDLHLAADEVRDGKSDPWIALMDQYLVADVEG